MSTLGPEATGVSYGRRSVPPVCVSFPFLLPAVFPLMLIFAPSHSIFLSVPLDVRRDGMYVLHLLVPLPRLIPSCLQLILIVPPPPSSSANPSVDGN
ncbi:hypothetical protein LZ30DRAFT_46592 [Colletotrichum cereale]|nr:hypothetical protein LZ30DRAFT_46592 [Colletotrichum cereale]